ncbi:MAG: hypothetical protein MJ247_04825 [Alphaproteobacteria bacterium]|nr:hypothetical protein [Alphaproteobacteria bacterium]
MNRQNNKNLIPMLLGMTVAISSVQNVKAQDLFDDNFLTSPKAEAPAPAPVNNNQPAPVVAEAPANVEVPAAVEAQASAPAPVPAEAPVADVSPMPTEPALDIPEVPAKQEEVSVAMPAPVSVEVEMPTADVPPPPMGFANEGGNGEMHVSQRPNDAVIGKVSSDVFREMAEVERENTNLELQLKREQLRSSLNALKATNRQMLFNEIERREKMTQARLEWELNQDMKRQDALERKQQAEIRQKQIEAALRREEDRRIEKLKKEEEEAKAEIAKKEAEEERKRQELKKKYEVASLVRLNNLKPTLVEVARPSKIKRVPSERASEQLTATGETLLAKSQVGGGAGGAATEEEAGAVRVPPAGSLYSVMEVSGVGGTLVARVLNKNDKSTFYVKKDQVLPSGHVVVSVSKDYILVQNGANKEIVGFQTAGLGSMELVREVAKQEMQPEVAEPVEELAPTENKSRPVKKKRNFSNRPRSTAGSLAR